MSAGSGDLGVLRWIIDADEAPLDAKLNTAEAKVRSWASRMATVTAPIFGGPGATTFSGAPVSPANAAAGLTTQAAPWGVQLPPIQAPTVPQQYAVPAGAFNILNNAGAGLGGTGASRAAFEQASMLNQPSGGGGFRGGGFRGLALYHFGLQMGREALQAEEQNYEFQRVLSRGTLDEQTRAGIAQAKYYDTGLTGFISRHATLYSNPISAAINYFRGGSTEDIRNAVENAALARQGQITSDEARRGTSRIGRHVADIGLTSYRRSISAAYSEYDEGMDEVRSMREKVKGLTGENNQAANELSAEADSRERVLGKLFGGNVAYRAQHRGLHIAGQFAARQFGRLGGALAAGAEGAAEMSAALIAAGGDRYGAQRALTVAEYARQEGGTTGIERLALRLYHGVLLGAQDTIHQRELRERAEDFGVAAEETTARNPFLSNEASFDIRRRALQNQRQLEVARYKAQNPNDKFGAAALDQAFQAQGNLLDQQAAFQAQAQDIGNQSSLEVGALLLARQPRAAAIAAIRGETSQRLLAAGNQYIGAQLGIGTTIPSAQAMMELAKGTQQEQLENQRQDDRDALIRTRLTGESDVLRILLGGTAETAAMSPTGRGIVGEAAQTRVQGQLLAQQFNQQGQPLFAAAALANTIGQLDVQRQNLFQNVRAQGVNLNLTDVQHPETSTQDLSKALEKERQQLVQDLITQFQSLLANLIG